MIVELVIEGCTSFWRAQGNGHIKPIISEGLTRQAAVKGYNDIFARQYHVGESLTALAIECEENAQ